MSRLPLLALVVSVLLPLSPLARADHPPSQASTDANRSGEQDRYDSRGYERPRDYRGEGLLHDQVHEAIESALGRDANRIRIVVRRGHVTLSGKVRDARTRARAHQAAHDVPGVHAVSVRRLYASRY